MLLSLTVMLTNFANVNDTLVVDFGASTTVTAKLLALATLGGTTQIGLFLFLVASPKVAKASIVSCRC